MKKLILLLVIVILSSCNISRVDEFDESPDKRLSDFISVTQSDLTSAQNGWILAINTQVSGGFNFWLKFNEANRVNMLSDFDYTISTSGSTSTVQNESSYIIKSLQTPTLIFDTYGYVSILNDPMGSVNGGTNGTGLGSDQEFAIISNDNGVYSLKGRYNSCKAKLYKVSDAQYAQIIAGGLKSNCTSFDDYMKTIKFPSLSFSNGIKAEISVSPRMATIQYIDGEGTLNSQTVGSALDCAKFNGTQDQSNLLLFDTLRCGDIGITALKFENGKGYYAECTDGKKIYVADNLRPVLPLRFGYGLDYTRMRIDMAQLSGTLVDPFLTNVYLLAKNSLYTNASKRNLQYAEVTFLFDAVSGKPCMRLTIRYNNTAGSNYTATWKYNYAIDNAAGTITFTDRVQSGSSNEFTIEPWVKSIPDYFCKLTYSKYATNWANSVVSSTTPVTFKMDWAENNTPGLTTPVAGFYPVLDPSNIAVGMMYKK